MTLNKSEQDDLNKVLIALEVRIFDIGSIGKRKCNRCYLEQSITEDSHMMIHHEHCVVESARRLKKAMKGQ